MSQNHWFETMQRWMIAAVTVALAGCGGGGGGGSDSGSSGNGVSYCTPTSAATGLAPAPAWLPFIAKRKDGMSSGQEGVWVASTANLAAPVLVDTNEATAIGAVYRFGRDVQGRIASGAPVTWVYKSEAGLARLDMEAGATPIRTAISSFSGPVADICTVSVLQTNASDPSTGIVLMRRRGDDGVCGGIDRFQIAHVNDNAATAPVTVQARATAYTTLYQASGAFGGFVGQEESELAFYPKADFSQRVVLKTGVSYYAPYAYNGREAIVAVFSGGAGSLYHVSSTGAISNSLYDTTSDAVLSADLTPDGQYLMFVNSRASGSPFNASLEQTVGRIPMDGSAHAAILYSTSGSANNIPARNIMTVTDSRIVIAADAYAKSDVPQIETMPIDRSASPKSIYRSPSSFSFALLATSGDAIFLNAYTNDSTVNLRPHAVAIDVESGKHQDIADAQYIGTISRIPQLLAPYSSTFSESNTVSLLRVDKVTPDATWVGSTVTNLNLVTCQETKLKNTSGGVFTFPEAYYTGGLMGYSGAIAGTAWQFTDAALRYQMDILAFDLDQSVLALVTRTLDVDETP